MFTREVIKNLANDANGVLNVVDRTKGFIPVVIDGVTKMAAVQFVEFNDSKQHTTGIFYYGGIDGFSYFCGNDFLEGNLDTDTAEAMMEEAAKHLPEENQAHYIDQMRNSYNYTAPNDKCINKMYRQNLVNAIKKGENPIGQLMCDHVHSMMASILDMDETLDELEKAIKMASRIRREPSDNPIKDILEEDGFQGECFMVFGPGGEGKTHAILEYAEDKELTLIEVHGHGQIEAIDLYGYVSEDDQGNRGWLDGPISEAARKAHRGEKVMLFIDEFANIPQRESAGLKASFEPYKGHYRFKTGRNIRGEDGLLVQETLEVPVENLLIVAASNYGDEYASATPDAALWQRFTPLYYIASMKKYREVLTAICAKKGFGESLVDNLMSFKDKLQAAIDAGEDMRPARLRHLSRKILANAKDESDLARATQKQMLQFVKLDSSGAPIEEQVELFEEIVEMTLAA